MGKRGPYKYKKYADYRAWLEEAGYAKRTVLLYVRGAHNFFQDGYELNDENIQKFTEKLMQEGQPYKYARELAQGVRRYRNFKSGTVFVNRYNKFHCDDDCFNCPYEDCLKPDYLCNSTEVEKW